MVQQQGCAAWGEMEQETQTLLLPVSLFQRRTEGHLRSPGVRFLLFSIPLLFSTTEKYREGELNPHNLLLNER